MIDWQPIETAPKTGEIVRIKFDDDFEDNARNHGEGDDSHNGWWSEDGLDYGYGASNPTHWRPLRPGDKVNRTRDLQES